MALLQSFRRLNLFLRRRYLAVIVVCVLLILLTEGAKRTYLFYIEKNWQTIEYEEEQKLTRSLVDRFELYQNEALSAASSVSRLQTIEHALSGGSDSTSIRCFEVLSVEKRPDIILEAFDSQKRLVGWGEAATLDVDTSQLFPSPHSFVMQGPLYSYLITSVPVKAKGGNDVTVGYIVAMRLFNVNYPISNRFINKNISASTFTSLLDISVQFDFSLYAKPQQTEQVFSVELKGIDGSVEGIATLNKPQLTSLTDEIHHRAHRITNIFVLMLVILLLYGISFFTIQSDIVKNFFWIAAIWFIRYVMLWTDVPSAYVLSEVFDPSYFASPYGWGLAKSVGDFFISAAFLMLTIMLAVRSSGNDLQSNAVSQKYPSWKKLFVILVIVVLGVLCCLILRGFSATIHSAVFDSSLRHNDPTYIVPPFVLSMLLLGIFLISCSAVIASVGLFFVAYRFVKVWFGFSSLSVSSWLISLALFCGGSLLFGVIHPTPLLSQGERLLYIIGIVVTTLLCVDIGSTQFQLGKLKPFVAIVVAGIIALIPQLDKEEHLLDRSHVELLAREIVRPADSWLSFVVNRSLDDLVSRDIIRVVEHGDRDDLQKLAFTGWAKSMLSQQGYNCSVLYVNAKGEEVSDFHLGVHESAVQHRIENSLLRRWMKVEERQSPVGAVKWYVGYMPLKDEDGDILGGVRVELSADKQALLLGEAPEILRNYTKENFERHNRTLLISEYSHAKLVYTTKETASLDRYLPSEIESLSEGTQNLWLNEYVGGMQYETYFVRQGVDSLKESWVGLSMEKLDIRWHLFTITRLTLFYLLVAFSAGIFFLLLQRVKGKKITINFRLKLLFAFIIVSFIPIVILGYYNRIYAVERAEELMIKRLSDETKIVVAALQDQQLLNSKEEASRLTNAHCEDIAKSLGTDFNVYNKGNLIASSKPEVYFAELLPTRLNVDVYRNVALQKQAFYSERQSIGSLQYIVGHRPLFSVNGDVIGTVSVPSLYRQNEIDNRIVRRNALLFGTYALAMLVSLLLGTIFANQISSPLRRLQQATQRVAGGDLSVSLQSRRTDEFGELERSFEKMKSDLKQTQEEMVRVQRELAWKEMAQQVAHEIKNPLTPIKLSIQHLRQAYKDNVADFGGLLTRISETLLEQVDALSNIASEFSQFARMPQRNIQLCSIHDILSETKNLFQQYPHISFDLELRAENAIVSADKNELQRAFINIVRNAVQAMNETGKIKIQTTSDAGKTVIRITDAGPGIPEEIHGKLFQPNFSTKSDGMGLGLSIVKQTVDAIGGEVSIESELGKGTTVLLLLPTHTKA